MAIKVSGVEIVDSNREISNVPSATIATTVIDSDLTTGAITSGAITSSGAISGTDLTGSGNLAVTGNIVDSGDLTVSGTITGVDMDLSGALSLASTASVDSGATISILGTLDASAATALLGFALGSVVNIRTFTTTDASVSKTTGATQALVGIQGPGGGAGGAKADFNDMAASCGGGEGSFGLYWLDLSGVTTMSFTIPSSGGSGGSGSSPSNGSAGSTASYSDDDGTSISINGGLGGNNSENIYHKMAVISNSANDNSVGSKTEGSSFGATIIERRGAHAGDAYTHYNDASDQSRIVIGSDGASSIFGKGGKGGVRDNLDGSSNGSAPSSTSYGAGGGGAAAEDNNTANGASGAGAFAFLIELA